MPYYDPWVVYGDWWWPGYPLFAWFPCCGPFITVGLFGWGWGIGVGPFWGWGWGFWNWGGRDIFINANWTVNINCTNCNVNVTRNNIRTASLRSAVATGAADPVRNAARVAGVRTGMHPSASIAPKGSAALSRGGMTAAGTSGLGNRPSAVSVAKGLSRGRNGTAFSRSGGTTAGTAGLGNRPSTASVQRGLSQSSAAFSRGATVTPNRSFASSSGSRAGFSRGGPSGGRLSSSSGSRGMFSTSRSSFSGSRFAGGHGGFGGGGHRR